eukprot:4936750-Pyramimonas_sp.AAC.1
MGRGDSQVCVCSVACGKPSPRESEPRSTSAMESRLLPSLLPPPALRQTTCRKTPPRAATPMASRRWTPRAGWFRSLPPPRPTCLLTLILTLTRRTYFCCWSRLQTYRARQSISTRAQSVQPRARTPYKQTTLAGPFRFPAGSTFS